MSFKENLFYQPDDKADLLLQGTELTEFLQIAQADSEASSEDELDYTAQAHTSNIGATEAAEAAEAEEAEEAEESTEAQQALQEKSYDYLPTPTTSASNQASSLEAHTEPSIEPLIEPLTANKRKRASSNSTQNRELIDRTL